MEGPESHRESHKSLLEYTLRSTPLPPRRSLARVEGGGSGLSRLDPTQSRGSGLATRHAARAGRDRRWPRWLQYTWRRGAGAKPPRTRDPTRDPTRSRQEGRDIKGGRACCSSRHLLAVDGDDPTRDPTRSRREIRRRDPTLEDARSGTPLAAPLPRYFLRGHKGKTTYISRDISCADKGLFLNARPGILLTLHQRRCLGGSAPPCVAAG